MDLFKVTVGFNSRETHHTVWGCSQMQLTDEVPHACLHPHAMPCQAKHPLTSGTELPSDSRRTGWWASLIEPSFRSGLPTSPSLALWARPRLARHSLKPEQLLHSERRGGGFFILLWLWGPVADGKPRGLPGRRACSF